MDSIRLKARAKINLGLDVLGKRDNGYHDVRMVMQTVGIYDRLIINKIPEDDIRIDINLKFLPVNENNLIYKAYKLMKDEYGFSGGIEVDLNKFIPIAAGMAGGSTDAASAMFAINKLFNLGLSNRELMEQGVKIGADVPYCIMRGTALAEGIGEILTPLPACPKCHVLIAKPPINVSTKFVYTNLRANELTCHPDIDGQIRALQDGDLEAVCKKMGNVLETVTIPAYPIIQTIKDKMMQCGAVNAMMSGSGPTVFGIFNEREQAEKAAELLREEDKIRQMFVTTAM